MGQSLLAVWVLTTLALAGCATTPYAAGDAAARQGRYAEAVSHYQKALVGDPDRIDALVGLGIARYKLGALAEAIDALERAVAHAPEEARARFYLGLSYLRKGDLDRADAHLTAFVNLKPERRLAAQVDRTLQPDPRETAPRGDPRIRGGQSRERGRAGTGSERGLAGARIRAIQSLVLSVLSWIVLRSGMLLDRQPAALLLAQPFCMKRASVGGGPAPRRPAARPAGRKLGMGAPTTI